MTSLEERIQGACNCGAIRISILKSDFPTLCSLCHCLNCRASSGSLFAVNLPTPTSAIEITGKPKVWADKANSGNTSERHFCGDCGSAIMTVVEEHQELAFVKGGLFKKFGVDMPESGLQIFTRRREPWEKPIDGVKELE